MRLRGARIRALSLRCVAASACLIGATFGAAADFRVCNQTKYLMNVAVGYDGQSEFQTEGWWSVTSSSCVSPIKGVLKDRFVYLYATDIDANDITGGTVPMCIERRKFLIVGTADCWRRGFEAVKFAEIDTLSSQNWTVLLGEGAQPP